MTIIKSGSMLVDTYKMIIFVIINYAIEINIPKLCS